jgi:hypothetical protein
MPLVAPVTSAVVRARSVDVMMILSWQNWVAWSTLARKNWVVQSSFVVGS